MPSTYSNLKIQLMATGENNTTWGDVTNLNLGTALEEAIVGSADVTFASGDVTLTLSDTNASQTARNVRLRCTGTTGGARNLIVPAIEKPYIVQNDCADAITVKNSTGTGIAVPAGKTLWVYNNGTNVVDAVTHLSSLTLTSALPAASGGTGQNSYTTGDILYASGATTLSKLADVATGNALLSGGVGVAPAWGKIGLTTHVSGTLPVANGGTGATTLTGYVKGSGTSAFTASATVPASDLSGTLGVANGGTGTSTAFTTGSIVFAGASGVYSQDNANLFWDDTNNRLGIGTASPNAVLTVRQANNTGDGIRLFANGTDTQLITRYVASTDVWQISATYSSTGAYKPITFQTSDLERMRISSTGNVSIGNTNNVFKLDVSGASTIRGDLNITPSSGDGIIGFDSANFYNFLYFKNAGSTYASIFGYLGNGLWHTADQHIFRTNYASPTERMRITSGGNVGIGTSSPGRPLHVYYGQTAAGAYTMVLQGREGGYGAGISFQSQYTGGALAEMARITADGESSWGTTVNTQDAGLRFYTALDGVVAEKMRLDSSGYLGIGTTAAQTALHVVGTVSASLGAAGAPTYAFIGDLDTGMWSPAANTVAFSTNSFERMRITAAGDVLVTGGGGLGYGTGSGGTVTQATSRTTGVTINKTTGSITLVSAAGTTTWQSFTVTNSAVAANDVVIVSQRSGTDLYMIHVTNVAAGSFQITFATTGGTTTEQPVFNFAVIKGATS